MREFAPRPTSIRPPGAFSAGHVLNRVLQKKLSIAAPGDEHEREADRIAAQVTGAPSHDAIGRAPPRVQRFVGPAMPRVDTAPPSVAETLATPGAPLAPVLRADMERRFGYDFSSVRVHADGRAQRSARDAGALAYTAGAHIVFGAGQFAPDTPHGERLIAHELTHVVQQRGRVGDEIQRAPGPVPTITLQESLEAIAQRIARLAVGPSSAKVNLEGGPGKVVSVVRNTRTGRIYVGLNTGQPAETANLIGEAIEAQENRILAGEVKVVHTAADAVGGHAEVNALNEAILEEEAALHSTLTEEALAARFEVHNVWLTGKNQFQTAPRCEHCRRITRGVSVTESLFKAEGGVSGEINVPKTTGTPPTTAPERLPSTIPEAVPEVAPEVTVPRAPAVAGSAVKGVLVEIGANVLLFVVAYYFNKWHAEKQARKFNHDLTALLPDINARLKTKEADVLALQQRFPLVYANVTIRYTHDKNVPDDYNAGSMSVLTLAVSHQNYQTSEHTDAGYGPQFTDPVYTMTFSVPLFEESSAEKGASSWLRNYRAVRASLTDSSNKVRLSALIALTKLAKQDASLNTLVVRDLLGALQDEDHLVRMAAAVFLSKLKSPIAAEYIPAAAASASGAKEKEIIEHALRELQGG